MPPRCIELDPVLDALKPLGKYQALQALLYFVSYFSCSYSLFSIVFTGQKAQHQCAPPANDTLDQEPWTELHGEWTNESQVEYGKCSISISSNVSDTYIHKELACPFGIQYEKPVGFSVVSEFDLVCDHDALTSLSQTLYILGQAVGALFFTSLSDRYGRKRIQVITHVLLVIASVVIGFAPNYTTFAVFKLFAGTVQQGVVLTTVTANVESFPGRYRGYVAGFVGALWWGIVTITLTPWAYFLRDYSWKVLQLAITSVGIVFIIQIKYLDEPMRWLLANGRTSEVVEQLKKAAKMNKRNVQDVLDLLHDTQAGNKWGNENAKTDGVNGQLEESANNSALLESLPSARDSHFAPETEPVESEGEKLSFLDLFRHKHLRTNTLCLWAVWCTNALTFFALILMSGSLTGNIYLSFFLNILVEFPACFIFLLAVERIGRRRTLLLFHSVAALSLLTCSVLTSFTDSRQMQIGAIVMSLIGKLGVSGSFNCVFFYTPEIFPTNIRNLAIGTGSTAARIGGMIAPFVGLLADRVVWAPSALFGVCNLLVLLAVRHLPESVGRELPQTLSDLETWYEEPNANGE